MGVELGEGDVCPSYGCGGTLEYERVEDCYCHISPPCSACVDAPLRCSKCGWEKEDE